MKKKQIKMGARAERPETRTGLTELIARSAYALYLARGGEHGHDVDDWHQAEQQILEDGQKVED